MTTTTSKPHRYNTGDHYVPQFYLRHWSDDGEQVWTYALDDRPPFKASTKRVALETGLYTRPVRDFDAPRDTEHVFSLLENEVSKVWPDIIYHCDDMENRKQIARWIALIRLRNPCIRDDVREIHGQFKTAASQIVSMENSPTGEVTLNLAGNLMTISLDELRKVSNTSEDAVSASFISILRSQGERLAGMLLKRRWGVIVSASPAFITTDNPILLTKGTATDQHVGFDTAGSEIFFPISPNCLLIISDEWPCDFSCINLGDRDIFNSIIALSAQRFVFGFDRDETLQKRIPEWRKRN